MHTTDPHGHAPNPGGGYERSDAKIRPLAESGALLVVLCLASFGSMIWLFNFLHNLELKKEPNGNALTSAREIPPAPLLETAPHMPVNWSETTETEQPFFKTSGLVEVRSAESRQLNGYDWIDKPAKLVHIPIHEAMQKLLEQGLPVRK
jgi:hypothetical protein